MSDFPHVILRVRKAPWVESYSVYEIEHGTQAFLAAFNSKKTADAFALVRQKQIRKETA